MKDLCSYEKSHKEVIKTCKFLVEHQEEIKEYELDNSKYNKRIISYTKTGNSMIDYASWKELAKLSETLDFSSSIDYNLWSFIKDACYTYAFVRKGENSKSMNFITMDGQGRGTFYFFEFNNSVYGFSSEEEIIGIHVSDYTYNGINICMIESDSMYYLCNCGGAEVNGDIVKLYEGNLNSFKRAVATGQYPFLQLDYYTGVIDFDSIAS